jgi:hypothetical protein
LETSEVRRAAEDVRIPQCQMPVAQLIESEFPPGKKLQGNVSIFLAEDLLGIDQQVAEHGE